MRRRMVKKVIDNEELFLEKKIKRRKERKELDRALALIHEAKLLINATAHDLKEAKNLSFLSQKPIVEQPSLFLETNLPEENKILSRVCLDSLVETLSDIGGLYENIFRGCYTSNRRQQWR
jgi:hypothetical protein